MTIENKILVEQRDGFATNKRLTLAFLSSKLNGILTFAFDTMVAIRAAIYWPTEGF